MTEKALRSRISCMPIKRDPVSEDSLHESLHPSHMSRHFVILEAMDIEGKGGGVIECMGFRIHTLGMDGRPCTEVGDVCVSGSVLNRMVTHGLKKEKFVYDGTINMKEGWIDRGLSQSLSQSGS